MVKRGHIIPDVTQVTLDAPQPRPRPGEYRQLTAADCRALAVFNAPFANDLDRHSENEPPAHPKVRLKAVRHAESSSYLRGYAADELRNRAAGDALTEYYQLANAEGQYDLLLATDKEVREQLEDALKAERAGLRDRADIPAIKRRLLEIEAQRAKLEATIGMLNASLRARLGLAGNDPLPLWPEDRLQVNANELDQESAVLTGLMYRPDLNLLRVLASGSAADMADSVLRNINPLLASAQADNPLVALLAPIVAPFSGKPERAKAETSARVASVLAARERQAEAEIRAAVLMLHGQRVAIAALTLDVKQIEERVAELETRQRAGQNVAAELITAKLELLRARGELLTAVTEWHTANVKLRQAMGLMVRE